MIAPLRIRIGRNHARKVVTAPIDERAIQVHGGPYLLVTAARTTTGPITHRRAQDN
ncbi:hypothetical protein [Saccharopolyspora erythraea]|uniref:Uncharacterized protein n=2 Tax=Saccharopolyspora erythraea TaxID=1836 RepID=A4FCQ2_SACEN|nr:hypothetical protein [Saccharopolyspora erythraea]EQD84115.1 hypothetical protein N599_21650 [Saccharopolyspora erythraea D]QRK92198.1 hypothetical protein JQX30_13140 [Saccharopolyspora erythraea]CAM01827.1 hypothetical protein SACE_2535 [Saccharopolyspora erythraea NRRL 2338]